MKNKLIDLNDHLFAQIERLSEEEMTPEKLAFETERSKAITSVAVQIISNARLALDAEIALGDGLIRGPKEAPQMLGMKADVKVVN